jgi:hypothetical protein
MTIQDRINRIRVYLASIEAKAGSNDRGPIDVALCDHERMQRDVTQIGVELGRRYEKAGGR